jgi:hypothetical protein
MRKAWHRTQGDYRRRFRGYGDTAREQASIRAADDTESERDMTDKQALKDVINGLPDIGAAKERAAIVAWLRGPEMLRYAHQGHKDEAYTCIMAAYAIERGIHIK